MLCGGWSGPPAWLVDTILAVAILLLGAELVGLFGWLTRPGLLLGIVALSGLVVGACAALGSLPRSPPPPAPRYGRGAFALAVVAALAVATIWSGPVLQSLDVGMYRQDSTWYHLTFSANFVQTAHTGGLLFTDPLRLTAWFYPQSSELLHAVGMVAFGRDLLSPAINLGWMTLTLLAAWCLGRPFGRGPATTIAVSVLLGSNMMQTQAGNAPSDAPALFFLLATMAILVNARAAAAPGPVFAAALAAGLAAGTKVTLLAPVAMLTIAPAVLAPPGARRLLTATWLGGVFLGGGFWYVRNAIHAGNPLPWVGLGPLPAPAQLPLYPRPPHALADYLASPGVWADWLLPGLRSALGPLWPAILLAAAAGLILALRQRRDPLLLIFGLAGITAAVAYALIPITAPGPYGAPYGFASNLRYLGPALLIGLVALVTTTARTAASGWVTAGLALAFLAAALASDSWALGQAPASLLLALGLLSVPFALARLARGGGSRAALAASGAAALLLLAGLGYAAQPGYERGRYLASSMPAADNPGFRSAEQWQPVQEWARRQSGKRIGIVGPSAAFGQYIFYGEDLSNRVRYIGQPGPHGSYRPIDNCEGWRWAIDAGGYDYVVITPDPEIGPTSEARETLWTRTDPAARLTIAAAPVAVFRIDGRLSPEACASQARAGIVPVPWGGIVAPRGGLEEPPGAVPAVPGLP